MIVEARTAKPFIHFGFNRTVINSFVGAKIKVYQDTIYRSDYSFSWNITGATIISQNANEIQLGVTDLGSLSIGVTINGVPSDNIIINSEPITWASENIYWNNSDITFNSI